MSEIRDRAAALEVSSRARVARGATRTARSLWRIDSSQALLLRRRPPFSGGGDAAPDADAVRARLRTVIRGSGLPVVKLGRTVPGREGLRDLRCRHRDRPDRV